MLNTGQPYGAIAMTFEIVPSSPQAQAAANKGVRGKPQYPFAKLEIGQSFTVKIDECNLASLQVITSRNNRKAKKFKMLRHDDLGVVEIARIA